MFKLTFPGTNVPSWLLPVRVPEGGQLGSLKFTNINLIWGRDNRYHVVPLLPKLPAITINDARDVTLECGAIIFHIHLMRALIDWVKHKAYQMRSKLTQLLNYFGLYTFDQFIEQVELKGVACEYVEELERALSGNSDPAKPIIVMGHNASIRDVTLQHGQNIIISPYATHASVTGVTVLPKTHT